jgi:hypothetical protein
MTALACSQPASQPAPAAGAPASSPSSTPASGTTPAPAAAAPSAASAPAAAAAAAPARLEAGSRIIVRTTRVLSTKTMKTGDSFSAILEEPLKAGDRIVAAEGARVDGRVVEADKGGRLKGKAKLSVELTSLTTSDGRRVAIVTSPVGHEAAENRKKDATKIGIGAGAGAAVGGIAAGGKGAAIGALIGGGAGVAMRGEAAEIPAEHVLSFRLRSPVTIAER